MRLFQEIINRIPGETYISPPYPIPPPPPPRSPHTEEMNLRLHLLTFRSSHHPLSDCAIFSLKTTFYHTTPTFLSVPYSCDSCFITYFPSQSFNNCLPLPYFLHKNMPKSFRHFKFARGKNHLFFSFFKLSLPCCHHHVS